MNLQWRETVKRHLREVGLADKAQSPEIVTAFLAVVIRVADEESALIEYLQSEDSRPALENADDDLDEFPLGEFDERLYFEAQKSLSIILQRALRDELTRRGFAGLVAEPEVLDCLVNATRRAAFEVVERASLEGGER